MFEGQTLALDDSDRLGVSQEEDLHTSVREPRGACALSQDEHKDDIHRTKILARIHFASSVNQTQHI